MPYIKEENRANLNICIENMMMCLKENIEPSTENPHSSPYISKISNEDLMSILGDINYVFSRIIAGIMGDVSYPKIAMATGVLENIKQELYRRAASPYEDRKILANGDIPEYKKLK